MADCGYHRDGVDVASEEGVALVRRFEQCATAQLCGIYTHGGHSYGAASPEAVAVVAAAERDAVTKFAATLRRSGLHLAISEADCIIFECLTSTPSLYVTLHYKKTVHIIFVPTAVAATVSLWRCV